MTRPTTHAQHRRTAKIFVAQCTRSFQKIFETFLDCFLFMNHQLPPSIETFLQKLQKYFGLLLCSEELFPSTLKIHSLHGNSSVLPVLVVSKLVWVSPDCCPCWLSWSSVYQYESLAINCFGVSLASFTHHRKGDRCLSLFEDILVCKATWILILVHVCIVLVMVMVGLEEKDN